MQIHHNRTVIKWKFNKYFLECNNTFSHKNQDYEIGKQCCTNMYTNLK